MYCTSMLRGRATHTQAHIKSSSQVVFEYVLYNDFLRGEDRGLVQILLLVVGTGISSADFALLSYNNALITSSTTGSSGNIYFSRFFLQDDDSDRSSSISMLK